MFTLSWSKDHRKVIVKVELVVIGMTCASCAMNVENALKKVDGVISAAVNLATRKATVEFNPGLVNVPILEKAIKDVGYDIEKSIEEDALTLRRRIEREERLHYRNRLIVGAIFTTPLIVFMFIDLGIVDFMLRESVRYSSLALASIVFFFTIHVYQWHSLFSYRFCISTFLIACSH